MDFNFDGLDEPIVLPDEYFSVIQYERLERFLHKNSGEWEDFRFVLEAQEIEDVEYADTCRLIAIGVAGRLLSLIRAHVNDRRLADP